MNLGPRPATRSEFLRQAQPVAVASALAGVVVPAVHAQEDNTIRVVLIGCGGRGTGAAANALSVKHGPVKLVALADVFPDHVTKTANVLKKKFGEAVDVPQDRQFIGFDAYRQAMDCLRPGDIVILATPPAFRWVQFGYAIEKGLHVFMEKPTTVDGPTTRKMLTLADEAEKKNLKTGVGLMSRHCPARQEMRKQIRDGILGDITVMRSYRMHGPIASFCSPANPKQMSDLLYQIRRFHSFLWASGGCFSDFNIHNIDECCWMKGSWPVQAQALGARHYRGDKVDQNLDTYSVEYTFDDGAKLFFFGRCIDGCYEDFSSTIYGTRGVASNTGPGQASRAQIFQGTKPAAGNLLWKSPTRVASPYQQEWDDFVDAIRQDKPYNEARMGAESSLVTSMGRMAAHTGRVITYDEMLQCPHEFAPHVDKLALDSPPPLLPDAAGRYPIPQPGIVTAREY